MTFQTTCSLKVKTPRLEPIYNDFVTMCIGISSVLKKGRTYIHTMLATWFCC